MDVASAKLIGAGLAAIGVGAASIGVGYRVRIVPPERDPQPGGLRRPAGTPVHRLRRRRASRPDGVRRRDAHPVRVLSGTGAGFGPGSIAMPQLSQLSEVYLSQFLWLAIALGFIFFVIARGMVPKIQATVDAREQRIAGDLEAAQRRGPPRTRPRRRGGRGWMPLVPTRRGSRRKRRPRAAGTPKRRSRPPPTRSISSRVRAGEIRDFARSARSEIEVVAAEATREMVGAWPGSPSTRKRLLQQ